MMKRRRKSMSRIYKMAKKYYDKGLWTEADLMRLVEAGQLTQEEYDEIVGANVGDGQPE